MRIFTPLPLHLLNNKPICLNCIHHEPMELHIHNLMFGKYFIQHCVKENSIFLLVLALHVINNNSLHWLQMWVIHMCSNYCLVVNPFHMFKCIPWTLKVSLHHPLNNVHITCWTTHGHFDHGKFVITITSKKTIV